MIHFPRCSRRWVAARPCVVHRALARTKRSFDGFHSRERRVQRTHYAQNTDSKRKQAHFCPKPSRWGKKKTENETKQKKAPCTKLTKHTPHVLLPPNTLQRAFGPNLSTLLSAILRVFQPPPFPADNFMYETTSAKRYNPPSYLSAAPP